ncbi:hypothetical protein BJP34_27805 [Moorena producens PAL-8-15-08-1]|uniref:Uncharacterized protein n=1 Tax=Moorena producens PAL-8-15-08-1 TaxID=1458985 RepID=A0A1D8TYK8_9CYAN|nr:hypothetical protein BJP34_27805 [Moorena producens PAL-8-15-08-1]
MNLDLDNFPSTSDQELIGLRSKAIDSKQVLECIKVRTNKRLNLSHRIKSMLMIEVDARVSDNGSNL